MIDLAQVLKFDVFEGSSLGFMARLLLPNNAICYLANISAIHYSVYNKTDGGSPVEGDLVVADVMYATAQTWKYDSGGFTFLWAIPGELMPDANKTYRTVIKFTYNLPGSQFHGKRFKLVWEGNTKDSTGG
jgi:hypothetical protein